MSSAKRPSEDRENRAGYRENGATGGYSWKERAYALLPFTFACISRTYIVRIRANRILN